MSARHYWAIWYDETHDSDGEFTGKTALSKHAWMRAEEEEEAGNFVTDSESDHGNDYDDWGEEDYPDYPDYSDHEDHEDHEDYDDHGDHDDHGDYYFTQYYQDNYYQGNSDWEKLNEFFEERYGSHTDLANLKLFYMELADSNYRMYHKHMMRSVYNEFFTCKLRLRIAYDGPVPVLGTIPVSTHIPFVPTSPTNNIVPFKKQTKCVQVCEVESSTSDDVTVLNYKFDVVSSGYVTDDENNNPNKTTPYTATPKTPSKTPRTRKYRRCDFGDIVKSNIFANSLVVA